MILTFHGHACVRLDADGAAVVIDPGTFSSAASALRGATVVLLTHDHQDHVDVPAVVAALDADPRLAVHGSGPATRALLDGGAPAGRVHAVQPGQELVLGEVRVLVGGGDHALIHPRIPQAANVTFRVTAGEGSVYHPGDSFDLPGVPVDVLLTPVSGPWLKLAEAMDYAAAAQAPVLVPIHDALLSEIGHGMVQRHLSAPALAGEHAYTRLKLGEWLDVPSVAG